MPHHPTMESALRAEVKELHHYIIEMEREARRDSDRLVAALASRGHLAEETESPLDAVLRLLRGLPTGPFAVDP